jgi:hypothetical protein
MKLYRDKTNEALLCLDNITIFFSYQTPVAVHDSELAVFYVTNTNYSKTTTRHVNSFVGDNPVVHVPQEAINTCIVGVKI